MEKKFGLGTVLAIGAAAAAVGGAVAAYVNREYIKEAVQGIADKIGAKEEEDGIFEVELDEEIVVHSVDKEEAPESDFVDAEGTAEEAPAEEAPAEEPAAPAEEPAPEA